MKAYDIIIIGAGPAGMSAALFAEGDGLNFRLVDQGIPCGFVEGVINTNFTNLENYLGLYDLNGTEVADIFRKHLESREVPIFSEKIEEISSKNNLFHMGIKDEGYLTKTVILATGTRPKPLAMPGIDRVARSVYYRADGDLSRYRGKEVLVVGGRNSGAVTAVRLKEAGANPVIIEKSAKSTAKDKYLERIRDLSIPLMTNSSLERVTGEEDIDEAHLILGGKYEIRKPAAIFGCIGYVPNSELAQRLGIVTDEYGFIEVDRKMRTSLKGFYAAGDVNGGVKMIAVASGEGAIAEYYINSFVRSEWKEK